MPEPQVHETSFDDAMGATFEALQAQRQEIEAHTLAFDALTRQRDEAVAQAAKPFGSPLREAKARLDEAQATRPQELLRGNLLNYIIGLPELSRAALGILIETEGGVKKFCANLLDAHERPERGYKMGVEEEIDTYNGFQAFLHELETSPGPVPVAVMKLKWFEDVDVQAEHEGRSSATGDYRKVVQAYFGEATAESLSIVTEQKDADSVFSAYVPRAVQLNLDRPRHLDTISDWGEQRPDFKEIDSYTHTVIGTVEEPHFNYFTDATGRLRWGSQQQDLSLMGVTMHQERGRVGPQMLVLYGDNLKTSLEALIADGDVDKAFTEVLQTELNRLP